MEQKRLPIFAERFNQLRGDKTQGEFADFLGISRPTVGFYENGDRVPDALVLRQIAEKCKASSDWLLGLSDVKVPDMDLRAIAEHTGLSEKAVEVLGFYNYEGENLVPTINLLIEQEWPPFPELPAAPYADGKFLCTPDEYISRLESIWESWHKLRKTNVPVLLIISDYLNLKVSNNHNYDITKEGELVEDKPDDWRRFDALKKISAEEIVEQLFLSKIENELKLLKEKKNISDKQKNTTGNDNSKV